MKDLDTEGLIFTRLMAIIWSTFLFTIIYLGVVNSFAAAFGAAAIVYLFAWWYGDITLQGGIKWVYWPLFNKLLKKI